MVKRTFTIGRDELGKPTEIKGRRVKVDIDYDPMTGKFNKLVFSGRRELLPKISDLMGLIQNVDVYVKTEDGTNILLDLLTQTAYLEDRRTLSNNGETPSWDAQTGNNYRGKFFPRGCRGFINTIDIYCKDAAATGGTITVYISPHPTMGYVASATATVTAGQSAEWKSATFNRIWNYDSLFIFVVSSTSDMKHGYDSETPYDSYNSSDAGATWTTGNYRRWFRVVMKAMTVGDVPVSGTLNTIEIPHSASSWDSGSTDVPSQATPRTLLLSAAGSGYCECILWTTTHSAMDFHFYCDGNLALTFSADDLNTRKHDANTPALPLTAYTVNDACYGMSLIHLEFKRLFEAYGTQQTGATKVAGVVVILNKIK